MEKFLTVDATDIWNVGTGKANSFDYIAQLCAKKWNAKVIEIPLPDDKGRKTILSIHLEKMSTARINISKIVEQTEDFSGAELKATTVEAGMIAIRDNRSKV